MADGLLLSLTARLVLDVGDGLLLGLALGLADGLLLSLAKGSALSIANGLVLGLTAGLALVIAAGVLLGLALGIAGRVKLVQWVPLVQPEEALGALMRKWLKAVLKLQVCYQGGVTMLMLRKDFLRHGCNHMKQQRLHGLMKLWA